MPLEFKDVDKGGWLVFESADNRIVGLLSNDFKHDVVLKVAGDFESEEHKRLYCELLAEKLNS